MVRCACAGTSKQSPPAEYAKGLTEAEPQPPRMCFPMYAVPLKVLLQMGEMIPHEELKATGRLVEFQNSLGKAMFVSHQWVGHRHPDPEFKQLKVLQDALTYVTTELEVIPVDLVTETMMPSAKGLRTAELRSDPLFIWYDYFSCPQLEYTSQRRDNENRSQLLNAIASIPAYVNTSSFFLALCPVVENPSQSMLFTPASWAERGGIAKGHVESSCLLSINDLSHNIKFGTQQTQVDGAGWREPFVSSAAMSHGSWQGCLQKNSLCFCWKR